MSIEPKPRKAATRIATSPIACWLLERQFSNHAVLFPELAKRCAIRDDLPAPQYSVKSLQDVGNIPISSAAMIHPEILSNVASISRGSEMEVLSHYNIRRVVDIYGSVQDRDLGGGGARRHPHR